MIWDLWCYFLVVLKSQVILMMVLLPQNILWIALPFQDALLVLGLQLLDVGPPLVQLGLVLLDVVLDQVPALPDVVVPEWSFDSIDCLSQSLTTSIEQPHYIGSP